MAERPEPPTETDLDDHSPSPAGDSPAEYVALAGVSLGHGELRSALPALVVDEVAAEPMVPAQIGGTDPATAVIGTGVILVGAWLLRIPWRSARRLAAMVRTRTRPVGDVEPGRVEVQGKVVSAGETVEGSLTSDEAVVTEYRRTRSGEPGTASTLSLPLPQQLTPNSLNRVAAAPFYLEDETGRVLVDAACADLRLNADAKTGSTARGTREVESRLEPGDDVYVLGTAVPAAAYSPAKPGDGVLQTIIGFFLGGHERTPASAVMDDEELVITRRPGSPFLISDGSEWRGWARQLVTAFLWTVASLVLFVIGGYLVLDMGPSLPL